VGSPTARITPHWTRRLDSDEVTSPLAVPDTVQRGRYREQSRFLADCAHSMPCVLYESESSVELTYVSESVFDLLGFKRETVIGWHSFWRECLLDEDLAVFEEKFRELDSWGSTSLIHRMLNSAGLPVWVSHSLRKDVINGRSLISGCLVPIGSDKRVYALDQNVVARFVHKLGNHFQLLTLVINSLKRTLPASRETEILQDTVEKAIELTRTFSDCNQLPSWMSEIQLLEVVKAAAASWRGAFLVKNVAFEEDLDNLWDVTMVGDPFLLEIAFGQILESALDATMTGGMVKFGADLEIRNTVSQVARLRVTYSNRVGSADQGSDATPHVVSKKAYDGLGLSVASRFIEMHGGLLRIKNADDDRTEMEVSLPLGATKAYSCA
jgi:hypothetical protein